MRCWLRRQRAEIRRVAMGSMLSSIRSWSSSFGKYCFIRATTVACARSGFGEAFSQHLDVGEPLLVVCVGEVAVLVVVDLVAEKDDAFVVAEDPGAVVRGLARAEIDHREARVVEAYAC